MSNQPILIVEDEHIVAEDIKQTLISLGYRVVGIAASAEEALEKVAKDKPQLALMDIKIKGKIDGIETASLLYQNYGVPVVYLTAHADDETLSRAVKTSPYGYILKPFDEVELKVCLQLAFHKICREADGSLTEDQISIKHSPDSSAACEEIELALKKLPLFAALREQDLKTLASEAKIRILKGGEVLYFEGEEGIDCFLVLDGLLLMVKSSDCGKELIVDFVSPGDILGLTMVYPSAQSGVTVRAQKLSRIICIPSPLLNPFLESNPQLYRELLLALSERLRRSHNFSRSLAHDRAQVRVASALVALANRMVDCNNGEFPVVSLSRQELADLTGITVETAIRVTKAMERDGLLDLKRPYHIGLKSIEALRKISEERV